MNQDKWDILGGLHMPTVSPPDMKLVVAEAIDTAFKGIPEDMYDAAMEFMVEYVKTNAYFNGGTMLAAFRATGNPLALKDWRNKWGAMVIHGRTAGLYKKVGLSFPTTAQSHTKTLSQWRSLKYIGTMPDYEATARSMLRDLVIDVRTGKDTLESTLWKAFTLGKESRA